MRGMKNLLFIFSFVLSFGCAAQNTDESRTLAIEGLKLVEIGNFEDGIRLLKKARNKAPEIYDYSLELGRAYMLSGKYRMAEKYFYPLQFHANAQADVFILLAECYSEINDAKNNPDPLHKKELNVLRIGIEKLPHSGLLYLELAKKKLQAGEPLKALAVLDEGINNAPNFAENYFWASKIYDLSGDTEKAWLHTELFYNMSDDTEMLRTAALTIRETTSRLIKTKPVWMGSCTSTKMQLTDWKEQRSCLSKLAKNTQSGLFSALANRLEQIEELGFMEPYVASIYLKQEKEQFLVWLASHGKQFDAYRQWRDWNPLNIR